MADEDTVTGILKRYTGSAEDSANLQRLADAGEQVLLLVLGSGPSIAAYEALLSAQAANGMMYYNAVNHQQKSNLLSMAMTAKSVRYMLDPHDGDGGEFGEHKKF